MSSTTFYKKDSLIKCLTYLKSKLIELKIMESKQYIANVIDVLDNGDAVIELPLEMISDLGWKEGDVLDIIAENKKIIVKNLTKENDHARDNNSKASIR
jgi:hypothetical protein